MNFIDPELRPVYGTNEDGDIPIEYPSGAGNGKDSIGNGLYRVTLPDGTQVVVDRYGNIIG